jgi:hypothetical protein
MGGRGIDLDGTYGGTQQGQGRSAAESEVQSARDQKHLVNAHMDVMNLRKKAAEHQHEAAILLRKYRKEESISVKLNQKASKLRRHAQEYIQDAKEFESRAAELESQFHLYQDAKLEKMRIKRAKYIEKSAKMKMKAAGKASKAARLDQKATEHTAISKEFLEKSKLNDAEAKAYHDRAESLEKAIGQQQIGM